jgi:predicted DNA-binding transcriptional regulator AlpA
MSTTTITPTAACLPVLLTRPEMAKVARCSVRTLDYMRERKDGPPAVKIGGKVLFPADQARAWLLSRPVVEA